MHRFALSGSGLEFLTQVASKSESFPLRDLGVLCSLRYGSVSFNQYGRENPTGGMNEGGLVVEELWLDETKYPLDKNLPAIDTQDWIRYELDTSATVEEAIANAHKVRIDSEVKVHFLISDKFGNAATMEFLNLSREFSLPGNSFGSCNDAHIGALTHPSPGDTNNALGSNHSKFA